MQHAEVAELGRRTGLRIQGVIARAGSNPAFGTKVLIILLYFLFFNVKLLFGAQSVILKDIKLAERAEGPEVLLELSGKCQLRYGFLPDPQDKGGKLYIDLFPSVLDAKVRANPTGGVNGVKKVRVGQFDKDVVRVVLHLERDIKEVRYSWEGELLKAFLEFKEQPSASSEVHQPQQKRPDPYELLRALGRNPGKYGGFPISLNFSNVPVRDVLRLFSDLLGINLAVDKEVHSKVTMKFKDIPWDQAFEAVLRATGLGMEVKDNLVYVFPLSKDRGYADLSNSALISLEIRLITLEEPWLDSLSREALSLQKIPERELKESQMGQVLYTWRLQTAEGKEACLEQRLGPIKVKGEKVEMTLQMGFVPFVLQDGALRVIVECKRSFYLRGPGDDVKSWGPERVRSEIPLKEGELLLISGIGKGPDTDKAMAVIVRLGIDREG